ncbi:unnamed protein product [Ranitomeya imitator]|uniref:Parvalbumin n=1 Tax=Ranitomeya imitator TaxID=111125 RepID=A0ABN9M5I3_9NEOB|nr:unnamed protein product [Ranitomeya imitator]
MRVRLRRETQCAHAPDQKQAGSAGRREDANEGEGPHAMERKETHGLLQLRTSMGKITLVNLHLSLDDRTTMSITDILSAKDIDAALASVQADNSFQYKTFFQKVGLSSKSADQVKKVFEILDRDCSGYIEETSLHCGDGKEIRHSRKYFFFIIRLFLQNFKSNARALNDAETKAFLKAGDSDGDGKIGVDEFQALVKA